MKTFSIIMFHIREYHRFRFDSPLINLLFDVQLLIFCSIVECTQTYVSVPAYRICLPFFIFLLSHFLFAQCSIVCTRVYAFQRKIVEK